MSKATKPLTDIQHCLVNDKSFSRYLHSQTNNADDAAEVYQESILRVIEQAKQKQIDNPLAYAIRIAKNLLASLRDNQHIEFEEAECQSANPETRLQHQQKLKQLDLVIGQMPELRRKVFVMRRFKGLDRQQTALALHITEEAVSKHMVRAMADVQKHLDKFQ
ncbi:RNA polymerase sigma factor [Catenovulum sp. SX2]|uniref:RNA polymerase sigma factor n=1 Tax=Catenovulum sp. SX2 TaxID=3398614 RepID=UPI003F871A87